MKEKKEKQGIKTEFGNVNSKAIWRNNVLCAQFLRGYTNVSLLENVQPEDIEDIGEKLQPFVGVEYEGDAVKQIHLHNSQYEDVYVVGLLEHKSQVDYDVAFQLLKYMVGIWEMHRKYSNDGRWASRNKGFRYPLIIPIVYYEGKAKWTADMHWKDRVEFSDIMEKYVPDFTYEVVELHKYTKEELLSREEEMSLVMMLNGAQGEEDLDFASLPREQREIVQRIIGDMPDDVAHILAGMMYYFGRKLHLDENSLQRLVNNVEEHRMGELWANMDYINVPERLREIAEQKKELQRQYEKRLQEALQKQREKVRQQMEQEARQMKQEALQKQREEVRQQLEQEVWQQMEQEARQEIEQEVRQQLEQEALQRMEQQARQEIEQEVRQRMEQEIRQKLEQARQEMEQQIRQESEKTIAALQARIAELEGKK